MARHRLSAPQRGCPVTPGTGGAQAGMRLHTGQGYPPRASATRLAHGPSDQVDHPSRDRRAQGSLKLCRVDPNPFHVPLPALFHHFPGHPANVILCIV